MIMRTITDYDKQFSFGNLQCYGPIADSFVKEGHKNITDDMVATSQDNQKMEIDLLSNQIQELKKELEKIKSVEHSEKNIKAIDEWLNKDYDNEKTSDTFNNIENSQKD